MKKDMLVRVDKETWNTLRMELGFPKVKDREISVVIGRQFTQIEGLRKTLHKANEVIYGRSARGKSK